MSAPVRAPQLSAGPETWENLLLDVWDRVEAVRRHEGKIAAARLAHKAFEAIEAPARPAKETRANGSQSTA